MKPKQATGGPSIRTRFGVWLCAAWWCLGCQAEPPKNPPPATRPSALAGLEASAPTAPFASSETPPEPTAAAEPLRLPHQQADVDPENDFVVAPPDPLNDCAEQLRSAGVEFRAAELPLKQKRGQLFTCGAEQVVSYLRGPADIRYNGAPTLTCRMALALARFEQLAQEEAAKELGSRIARFTHIGTYSCRKMARFDWVSEHSYANAIDLQKLTLVSGKSFTIEKSFGALDTGPKTPEARFLRRLANRAFDEELFSVVLTPYWDKLHRDHLHLDLARYRVDGSRPQ
jgi:hypothetical protein